MIDLHTHSTASDGTDTPSELVEKAARQGVTALALTDHDTINGLEEAEDAAVRCRINFVRGCEVSTSVKSGHIVALWVPRGSGKLEAFLERQVALRDERTTRILDKLKQLGLPLSLEEIKENAGSSIGRPHIADALVKKGYVQDHRAAFEEYLGRATGKAYAPRIGAPTPFEAIKFLNSLGATVVMAHPFEMKLDRKALEKMIFDAKAAGLSAIEAWHSSHDEIRTNEVIELARRNGLALSGGSDYHGLKKADISLGTGVGNLNISENVYKNLVEMRKAKGLPV